MVFSLLNASAGRTNSRQTMSSAEQAALPLTVEALRDLLVATGTPQSGDFGRPIGPMPDLAAAIQSLP